MPSRLLVHALAVAAVALPTTLAAQQGSIFLAPLRVLPNDSAPFARLFDYDADGDQDAVGGRVRLDGLAYEVQVWRNDQGAFTEVLRQQHATVGGTAPGVEIRFAVGDFDGDTFTDFAVGAGTSFDKFRSLGNGAFTRQRQTFATVVTQLAAGDIDRDGISDLVVRLFGVNQPLPWTAPLHVFLSQGGVITGLTSGADAMFLFDYDVDPWLELGVYTGSSGQMHVFDFANSQVAYAGGLFGSAPSQSEADFTVGDIDGDGDEDLVFGRTAILKIGPGQWQPPILIGGTGLIRALVDIDGDGDLDGVGTDGRSQWSGSGTTQQYPSLQFRTIFGVDYNDGTGQFTGSTVEGFGRGYWPGVADLDLDGDVDLVGGGSVFYASGHPYLPVRTWLVQDPDVAPARCFVDVDRDGDLDFTSSMFVTFVNRGDGVFTSMGREGLAFGGGLGYLGDWIEADFDGDGAPDIVTGRGALLGGLQFAQNVMLRNKGGGRWRDLGPIPPATQLGHWRDRRSNLTADLDGDDLLDLVMPFRFSGAQRSEISIQLAGGGFAPLLTLGGERVLGLADLDGDGRTDLVTADFSNQNLGVRRNTGNPAAPFSPRVVLRTTIFVERSFTLADVDDDGLTDIVCGDQLATIDLLVNRTTSAGPWNFVTSSIGIPDVHTFPSDTTIQFGDVDLDGRIDMVVEPVTPFRSFGLLRRTSAAGVVPTQADYDVSVFGLPNMVAAGALVDADGDGDLDLVGDRFWRNTRFEGPAAGSHVQYGTGTAGEDGAVPLLGIEGPVRAPGTLQMRLSNITGPTLALLAITLGEATIPNFPVPGVTALVDPTYLATAPWWITSAGGGEAGALAETPAWLPAAARGLVVYQQAFVLDPAGPGGVAASNGLRLQAGG